jgi:EAL domain-containing protein (putative c-di-GMP-specific phosphodiesterase class I)
VTAEGVETVEQMNRLKDLACEFGQGFYFHQPLTGEHARELLTSAIWATTTADRAAAGSDGD